MSTTYSLRQLGWQPYYQQQLSLEEYESCFIARVISHHKSEFVLQLEERQHHLNMNINFPAMTVGDWLLLDENLQFVRLLERKSKISRKAAGTEVKEQLIAANIDVLFIVTSLNQDFNLNRIERYLAIAHEAQIEPVIVLTKRDLNPEHSDLIDKVKKSEPDIQVIAVNALSSDDVSLLDSWCQTGKTISVMGSSGVGKSTLINTLLGEAQQSTGSIRTDDDKGRHTTIARSIHIMSNKAVLLDTPGMRELQLATCQDGLAQTFSDIENLAKHCRFTNCQHQSEPGCAVQQAIESGELEPRRLKNFVKLYKEEQRNSASLVERRASDKALSKMYRRVLTGSQKMKKGL